MNKQPIADELYSAREASEFLGYSQRWVIDMVNSGKLESKDFRVGQKTFHLIAGKTLLDYLAEQEEDQPLPFESADMDRLIRRVDTLSELVKGLADAIIMLCKEEEAEAAAGKKFYANLGDGLARLEKMEE